MQLVTDDGITPHAPTDAHLKTIEEHVYCIPFLPAATVVFAILLESAFNLVSMLDMCPVAHGAATPDRTACVHRLTHWLFQGVV